MTVEKIKKELEGLGRTHTYSSVLEGLGDRLNTTYHDEVLSDPDARKSQTLLWYAEGQGITCNGLTLLDTLSELLINIENGN